MDFYCPERRLAIEIDGATHSTHQQIARDEEKEAYIERFGIELLRFMNDDIYKNLDGVLSAIAEAIEKRQMK